MTSTTYRPDPAGPAPTGGPRPHGSRPHDSRPHDSRPAGRRRSRALRSGLLVLLLLLAAAAWAVLGVDRGTAGAGAGGPAPQEVGPGAGAPTALDPELERRFAEASAAAAADGVELTLTSGWRTAEEQQRLVDQAVERYGTPEAYRWVLPPERSAHVQGLAVDVGPTDGALWLEQHGLEHGLCRTYANELWHFEMLPDGATACAEMHPDSSWGW